MKKAKPPPKGPTADLMRAVVEMKPRNPTWGCPHIADQINLAFGTYINKHVVRRILATHYRPQPGSDGPSWWTFLGHTRTAYGRSTYSVVNPCYYGRIGFWW
jgi:hypothetical protein